MKRITAIVTGILIIVAALGAQHSIFARDSPEGSQAGLGSKIVFGSTQNIVPEPPPGLDINPAGQLYVMNADGSEQRPLTDFIGAKLGAACSPNGQQIAFHGLTPVNSRPAVPSILLMDANTFVDQNLHSLIELVSGGLFPSW